MTVAKPSDYQAFKGEHPRTEGAKAGGLPPTTPDILGPYYKPGAPDRTAGGDLTAGTEVNPNTKITISGRVLNTDGDPVAATLDIWQADQSGNYDLTEFTLRGKVVVDPAYSENGGGNYEIRTVRPGHYKISDPGQPDEFRCAHIHVIVDAPPYKRLVTQLYFADDPFDEGDHWYSPTRLLKPAGDRRFTFDFVLQKE